MDAERWQSILSCDLTLPYSEPYDNLDTILPRYVAAGISFVSLSVSGDRYGVGRTTEHIAAVRKTVQAPGGGMMLAPDVASIRRAKRDGKLAVNFNFQGSNGLGGHVEMVEVYYALGVRQMLLAYNKRNAAADGCLERVDAGLSSFGLRVVAEMNRVGMLVDGTHMGIRSSLDCIANSSAPVIFSHSNARALRDHERNLTDEQIRACAASGGVIGVVGVGNFLSDDGTATVSDMLRHVRYISDLVGSQHVAIGTDNVYFAETMYRLYAKTPERWTGKNKMAPPPWHYFDPEQLPDLAEAISMAGFSDTEMRGILGENYLRVAAAAWR